MSQADLFSASDLAAKAIPLAPALRPHEWPFPGMTPADSARSALAMSREYSVVIAELIKDMVGPVTEKQIIARVPDDWKSVLGPWIHASLCEREARGYGISVKFVGHDGGAGFHFSYSVSESSEARDKL